MLLNIIVFLMSLSINLLCNYRFFVVKVVLIFQASVLSLL